MPNPNPHLALAAAAEQRANASGLSFSAFRDANARRELEWDADGKCGVLFAANELAGEVGEACNIVKKMERTKIGLRGGLADEDAIPMLAEELADVVICADLCAMRAGIDLESAVISKFNATSKKYGLSVILAAAVREQAATTTALEAKLTEALALAEAGYREGCQQGHRDAELDRDYDKSNWANSQTRAAVERLRGDAQ